VTVWKFQIFISWVDNKEPEATRLGICQWIGKVRVETRFPRGVVRVRFFWSKIFWEGVFKWKIPMREFGFQQGEKPKVHPELFGLWEWQ